MKQSQFLLLLGVICMCSPKESPFYAGIAFIAGSFVLNVLEDIGISDRYFKSRKE